MMESADLLMTLIGFVATVSVAMGGWSMHSIVKLRERMAVVESERFTALDGERLKAELTAEIRAGNDRLMRCIRKVKIGDDCEEAS